MPSRPSPETNAQANAPEAPPTNSFNDAERINELVEASLQQAFDDSLDADQFTLTDTDLNSINWQSLQDALPTISDAPMDEKAPMNIPKFFPQNFFKPFTMVPEPDKNGATAQFEGVDAPKSEEPLAIPYNDPLALASREQMRQIYPNASEAELDVQVSNFMANLKSHSSAPVRSEFEEIGATHHSLMEDGEFDDGLLDEFSGLGSYRTDDPLLELGDDLEELHAGSTLFDERINGAALLGGMDTAGDAPDVEEELEQALQDAYGDDLDDLLGVDPARKPYKFEKGQPRDAAEALADGERLYGEGRLYEAMDALEMAVVNPSLEEHALMLGWYLLGASHMENGDDVRAIQALCHVQRVVAPPDAAFDDRHPLHVAARAALLLACAYANEFDGDRAQAHLRRWLSLHAEQHSIDIGGDEEEEEVGGVDTFKNSNRGLVARLDGIVGKRAGDADVLCALAVAKTLAESAATVMHELRGATEAKPTDVVMWLRLGDAAGAAGAVDDAVRAFRIAADMRPGVARIWKRVGVAHLSTAPLLAVRYLLHALAMASGEKRAQLHREPWRAAWAHVKAALYATGQAELVHYADEKDIDTFRSYFSF